LFSHIKVGLSILIWEEERKWKDAVENEMKDWTGEHGI